MVDKEAIADYLESAADAIEIRGWRQKELGTSDGSDPVCVIGALTCTSTVSNNDAPVIKAALETFRGYMINNGHGLFISDWNDSPDRTKEEVLDTLRSAAKAVLSEEIEVYNDGLPANWG